MRCRSNHRTIRRYATHATASSAHCNLFSSADTVLAAIQIPPPLAAAFLPWRVGSDRIGSRLGCDDDDDDAVAVEPDSDGSCGCGILLECVECGQHACSRCAVGRDDMSERSCRSSASVATRVSRVGPTIDRSIDRSVCYYRRLSGESLGPSIAVGSGLLERSSVHLQPAKQTAFSHC